MSTIRNSISRLIDQKNKKQQSETMDPINALQNLTNQGARNPMSSQMMNAGNNQNPANVLQNLIHQRAGQQQMQGMPNMQGMRANQAMQNTMTNVVGNQMQQGNAMPPGAMNSNNMNMNMGKSDYFFQLCIHTLAENILKHLHLHFLFQKEQIWDSKEIRVVRSQTQW